MGRERLAGLTVSGPFHGWRALPRTAPSKLAQKTEWRPIAKSQQNSHDKTSSGFGQKVAVIMTRSHEKLLKTSNWLRSN